jgi:hypothetical protein
VLHFLFLLVWPFLFLFQHVRGKLTISNDIGSLYYPYKPYLLAAIAQGHFPLWSPTEEGGYPFFCNPFAQAVYALNLPLQLWYKRAGGLTFWDYEMYTIFGLSIYGVGLYLWLRSLALPSRTALTAAMIAVVSLKLTELLRFPNALHCAAWMPWLLWGATRAAQRRNLFRAPSCSRRPLS